MERLDQLSLFSLEQRWLRNRLIELYKIMGFIARVDRQNPFSRVGVSKANVQMIKVLGSFKGNLRGKFLHSEWLTPGMCCLKRWWN